MPIYRAEGGKFVANGKLYTFGGFNDQQLTVSPEVDVYDLASNTWSKAAPMPVTVTHAAQAVYGDTVYIGMFFKGDGIHSSNLLLEYHIAENTWSYGPNLPDGRGAGGMGIAGNTLFAWGGLDIKYKGRAEMWSLDLTNPSAGWVTEPPMPEALDHFGFASLGGKLYTVGGITDKIEDTSNHSTVYVFDPATRQWSQAAPLPLPLGHIGPATTFDDRYIYVTGGQTNDPTYRHLVGNAERYDTLTNHWDALTAMPVQRMSDMNAVIDGKLVFTGGNKLTSAPYIANDTFVGTFT
jgi:N-acetylneuraminic acid mutarotase